MLLKGALHVHTTCSDGDLSVQETLSLYRELGFGFVALTDHDLLMRPGCYDQVGKFSGGLIVFTGKEMTLFERGYCHLNRIKGDRKNLVIFNHPAQLSLPLAGVVDRIESVAEKTPLDAVEITSNGFRTPEFEVPEIPYPKVATDDAHTRVMFGRAWVETDCRPEKDAIIEAIKNGDFQNRFRT